MRVSLLIGALLIAGCGAGELTAGGDGSAGTADQIVADTTAGDGQARDLAISDTPTPSSLGIAAGGLHLTGLVANQGVDIPLVADRTTVATSARIAPLISGRAMLLRADYTVDPGFTPRSIDGFLVLHQADGSSHVLKHTRAVQGPADMNDYNGTFRWLVSAQQLQASTSVSVLLAELDSVTQTSGDASEARLPSSGDIPLEAWGDRMVLDIVLVPYDCGGSHPPLDLSQANIDDFRNYLFNTFPVQEINLTVHQTLTPSVCSEYEVAENDLPALRAAENAPPYVYYGGLLNGNGGGYSIWAGESDTQSFRRTFAANAWRDFGLTFDLFAHELGHNHERAHSFEDASYPNENSGGCGARVHHGYGIVPSMMPHSGYSNDQAIGLPWIDPSTQLIAPTSASNCDGLPDGNAGNWNDFMSYTYPYWVSAYTYAALAQRIRLISSWSTGAGSPGAAGGQGSAGIAGIPSPGQTLRAIIKSDGSVDWNANAGTSRVRQPAGHALCFDRSGRKVARYALRAGHSQLERFNNQRTLEVLRYTVLEVPLTGPAGDRCTLYHGERSHSVDLKRVRGFTR